MAELLIVYHSRTGGSRQMAEAAHATAREETNVRLLRAGEAGPEDHIQLDLGDPQSTMQAVDEIRSRLAGGRRLWRVLVPFGFAAAAAAAAGAAAAGGGGGGGGVLAAGAE